MRPANLLLLLLISMICLANSCEHHTFGKNVHKHIYNDLHGGRTLQQTSSGQIRIYADYTNVTVGDLSSINIIKRIINITASYFYSVLNVTRLNRLYFPSNVPPQCSVLTVPATYITSGTIGDFGLLVGNENNNSLVYVAKSTACALLQSNSRPYWGVIIFNNPFLKYDQQGFQESLFIAMHEMTHCLGFSAFLYQKYVLGNPLINVTRPDGSNDFYLSSSKINREVSKLLNCANPRGMLLEDQDGTLFSSHWQKKVAGNEYMIASTIKGAFVSNITLALLDSTGWYTAVNYSFGEPTTWGKNKGCSFLDIDNCNSSEFCNPALRFNCDWWGTGIGGCQNDVFTGTCMMYKYFTNTICVDENYQLRNLNAALNAQERGGYISRCFNSDYRAIGLNATILNNRCYNAICSSTGQYLFILVSSYILVCFNPGQVIKAPLGFVGTLTCPLNFDNYCAQKKTCPYHCNTNGACVNGQCLCTGTRSLAPSCLSVSFTVNQVGSTGGFLMSLAGAPSALNFQTSTVNLSQVSSTASYSINSKCSSGLYLDEFGECSFCQATFNCQQCTTNGCANCDDPRILPVNGIC